MATRAIVTSQPVVACDVCGRRLLRGETPDVFLVGGQRRTVCELCVPRAAAEGWRRESEQPELSLRPPRPRRAGSLFGRLRQLREPQEHPLRRAPAPSRRRTAVESERLYEEHEDLYELPEEPEAEQRRPRADGGAVFIGSVRAEGPAADPDSDQGSWLAAEEAPADPAPPAGEPSVARALRVFNEGETPQRVAGIARSLGAPTVAVRALAESPSRVAVVVAWELCWYRYEVDLDDELAGVRLADEGMELAELPDEDRLANVVADERGELALIA